MRFGMLALLALAGCDRQPGAATTPDGAGAALEKAAIGVGIVADPATIDPVGAYASDSDRVCIIRADGGYRIGASVDYGEQQGCIARGTVSGSDKLKIDFGDDCRVAATFDGERIVFAPTIPDACERRCTGRATLAALSASRLSATATEARAMHGPDEETLCS